MIGAAGAISINGAFICVVFSGVVSMSGAFIGVGGSIGMDLIWTIGIDVVVVVVVSNTIDVLPVGLLSITVDVLKVLLGLSLQG